jgi:pantothenate kinase type III
MIAIDAGNTQIKFGYYSKQSLQHDLPKPESHFKILYNKKNNNLLNNTEKNLITNWLQNIQDNNDWYIAITASNHADSLIRELTSIKPNCKFKILKNNNIPITANVDSQTQTGIDRLLDALAATKFAKSNLFNTNDPRNIETIIVVDAGTAITVDMIRVNMNPAVFEGGVILSGLGVLSVMLNRSASHLPEVEFSQLDVTDLIYPAKNTKSAILSGILGSLIATIDFFAQKTKTTNTTETDKKIPIILTGGDATIIGKLLAKEFSDYNLSIIPDLTLMGIALAAASGQF